MKTLHNIVIKEQKSKLAKESRLARKEQASKREQASKSDTCITPWHGENFPFKDLSLMIV